MNKPEGEFFDELMQQVSEIEKAKVLNGDGGCARPGSGGDCLHFIGLPGESIPNQHDGPDDTVDVYDKPNGWCWSCWKSYRIDKLHEEVQALEAWQNVAGESNRNVSAYLQKRFSSLNLDEDGHISNIHKVVEHLETEISASEAVFGFIGWLTSRDESVTFSGHHNAATAADLAALFCEFNNLSEPRNHWEKNLIHPKECHSDVSKIDDLQKDQQLQAAAQVQFGKTIKKVLDKLSGALSYDNVSEAKKILKNILN